MKHTKDFETKREEIIDCAEALFVQHGYEPTSVNMILTKVGIAKGTFYYYFCSKEEVMDAVIMRVINCQVDYANQAFLRNDITVFEKFIIAMFGKSKTDLQQNMIKQLCETNNALMKQRALQRTIEFVCPVFVKILKEGNSTKEFHVLYPLEDVQFLVSGIQSLYDLSNVMDSEVQLHYESILHIMFQVLCIDETKISKAQASNMIMKYIQ